LPGHRRITEHVEQVVDDLEAEADCTAVAVERIAPAAGSRGLAAQAMSTEARINAPGLALVHFLDLPRLEDDWPLLRDPSPGRRPCRSCRSPCASNRIISTRPASVDTRHRLVRKQVEGEDLQRVSGEDCGRLVEGAMRGRPAATQVVVVHGRADRRERESRRG
jgi:hypothetical protein